MAANRIVRCPQCGGESLWSSTNAYRPFCSERCKMIDLGAWASESYRVPVQEDINTTELTEVAVSVAGKDTR